MMVSAAPDDVPNFLGEKQRHPKTPLPGYSAQKPPILLLSGALKRELSTNTSHGLSALLAQ
jgi:hypothetical protein